MMSDESDKSDLAIRRNTMIFPENINSGKKSAPLDVNVRAAFLEVLSGVLERFAFMFVESADECGAEGDVKGAYLYAVITFTGRTQGAISLAAPDDLCREMAANVLGMDPSETVETAGEDALKELVNIICGELTVALYGNEDVFNLTVPNLYRVDRSKWRELGADSDSVKLSLEGKPLVANLMIAS